MNTIDAESASKLAGLQIDLLQKIRQEHITLVHLEWFLNLSKVQRNTVSGVDFSSLTKETPLLEFVTSVTVPGVDKFIAADHFKHGETVDGVRCYLWEDFQKHFLGKTEENVAGCDIRIHKLLKGSRDLGIRSEIGEEKEEIKLANLWSMLKLQSKGESGALLINGYANIFYVRDTEGTLWAVSAYWRADYREWRLFAYSIGYQNEWSAGYQVCSR
ncbi:MAG: hypothetical protein G01um101417_543 [Parcubacteria group bacterium Gr01-1014_17]|nr:MAG: hypothetical protein G01um101417_543 [Parcubacteria group bacterium Gr01-1014_17]